MSDTQQTESLQTPSQTIGPFYGFALPFPGEPEVVPPTAEGTIRFHGDVLDGEGGAVFDSLIESWGANPDGSPATGRGARVRTHHEFSGFGRTSADPEGHYSFTTLKPGAHREGSAPYLFVTVFARGLLTHLFTRAYFGDEAELNANDPLLSSLPEDRRETLIAQPDGAGGYRFDIRLQGPDETVFLEYPV